ncbi:MAG: hypothetical protein Q4Q13_03010 [Vagococcus sp.]|nr:hypothetical protein [Vagococcus sp.]
MVELNHYYHDRGIKKYLGFYLSEHTHALETLSSKNNDADFAEQMMSEEQITEVIDYALVKNLPVLVQPNIYEETVERLLPPIKGYISGHTSQHLFIHNTPVPMSLIRSVRLLSPTKWFTEQTVDDDHVF